MSLLNALCEQFNRLEAQQPGTLPSYGWSREEIWGCLTLDEAGDCLGIVALGDHHPPKGTRPRGQRLVVPNEGGPRTSRVVPNFLWGNTKYVLGVGPDTAKKTAECHAAFKSFHRRLLQETDDPSAAVLLIFLNNWNPSAYTKYAKLVGAEYMLGKTLVIRIADRPGEYLHSRAALMRVWMSHIETQATENRTRGMCLVTGERDATIPGLHPPIKIPGAPKANSAVVSTNESAFVSYGSRTPAKARPPTPVSAESAHKYTAVLNHLSRNDRNSVRIGGLTYVYWSEAELAEDADGAVGWFNQHVKPRTVEQADKPIGVQMQQAKRGKPIDLSDDVRNSGFCIAGIKPNSARLFIHSWHRSSFGMIEANLLAHAEDMHIEPAFGGEHRPLSVYQIACLTVPLVGDKPKRDADKLQPQLLADIMHAVLNGTRYSDVLVDGVLNRARNGRGRYDQRVWERESGRYAAVCKAAVNRRRRINGFTKGGVTVELDKKSDNASYCLGRLLAVYEKAQRDASGDVARTVVDVHLAEAMWSPVRVYPQLAILHSHHVGKLQAVRTVVFYANLVNEIYSHLTGDFPRSQSDTEQCWFLCGYYHQRRALWTKNRSNEDNDTVEGDDR